MMSAQDMRSAFYIVPEKPNREEKLKNEPTTYEDGKLYTVESPETGIQYPAFWSADRERFVALKLSGGEVVTYEFPKGCEVKK